MTEDSLGTVLDRLAETIASRKDADAVSSYTARLVAGGTPLCARKFGEESVEAIIAAMDGDKASITAEAADVLYHLLTMLAAAGVPTRDVAAALFAREGTSGLEEKASRRSS